MRQQGFVTAVIRRAPTGGDEQPFFRWTFSCCCTTVPCPTQPLTIMGKRPDWRRATLEILETKSGRPIRLFAFKYERGTRNQDATAAPSVKRKLMQAF